MAHQKDLRKGRFSLNNGIYLATFATKKREPLFSDFYLARIIVWYLNNSPHADTQAYVVMPDHVHWLIQLRSAMTLSQTVRAVKTLCTKSINMKTSRKGTIWETGFHDHGLRNEEALKAIARYVVANPVRANLVKSVRDYPHWDACWFK
ncbi:MAG: putative transposase [Lysobacterales bacterium]|jgi:putative transposase